MCIIHKFNGKQVYQMLCQNNVLTSSIAVSNSLNGVLVFHWVLLTLYPQAASLKQLAFLGAIDHTTLKDTYDYKDQTKPVGCHGDISIMRNHSVVWHQ